jgi:hypothetical protein
MRPSLCLASLVLSALAQEPVQKAEPELYPAERPRAHVLFFMLEGELKAEPLRKALADLSTKEAECKLVYGPRKTSARPGAQFVAVEAPAALGAKELVPALRKGCSAADPVACTVFKGSAEGTGSNSEGGGWMGGRELVLGMSGDIRWYDALAGWRQFYFGAGKIGSKEIADRYAKLFGPLGGAEAGEVVRESLRWTLAEPLDPKIAARAEKAIGKLPGVARAAIDPAQRLLSVDVRLENLKSSGPALPFPIVAALREALDRPAKPEETGPVRARFDTVPLFEILDKEGLTLAPAPPAEGGK